MFLLALKSPRQPSQKASRRLSILKLVFHSFALCVLCQCSIQRSHVTGPQFQSNGKMQGISSTQAMIVQLYHFSCMSERIATNLNNAYATFCQRLELFAHPFCVGLGDLARAQLDR